MAAKKTGALIYNHHADNDADDVTKRRRRRLLPLQQHSTRILFDTRRMPMRRTRTRRRRRRRNVDVAMMTTTTTGGVRTPSKLAWSLLLFTLTYVNLIVTNHQPILFVGADLTVKSMPEDDHVNAIEIDKPMDSELDQEITNGGNHDDGAEDVVAQSVPPLPASLMKATRVGAKIREVVTSGKKKHSLDDDDDDDDDYNEAETMALNLNDNDDGGSDANKPPPTGCGWGTVGCNKKGSNKRQTGSEVMNASSIVEEFPSGDDEDDVTLPPASSLAGSATAKIKARVTKKKGGNSRVGSHPVYDRDTTTTTTTTINVEPNSIKSSKKETLHHGATGDNKPPHGFQLAGRVVTSPNDGLSYFLDAPKVTPEDTEGSWMMTIPYAYLECGPTIESTTEAFLLGSMVLRHFPASASMSHWTNLGGGVTIEDDDGNNGVEGEGKWSRNGIGGGSRYIEGSRESYPKLIVPLSPIEITVSGNDEETRVFNPGDVILMEDTLGKGHKMKAATTTTTSSGGGDNNKDCSPTRDLSVLMVSLPHEVHFPMNDWVEESSSSSRSSSEDDDGEEFTISTMRHSAASSSSAASSTSTAFSSPPTPSSYDDAHRALYGFAPKHLHSKHHRRKFKKQRSPPSFAANAKKPCPLEYDSAYSSLFMPAHDQYHKHYRYHRHHRRYNPRWGGVTTHAHNHKDSSSFDESYPPPPGYTTYEHTAQVFDYLPSLRRTMLFGLGLSLSSSFIYCVQLLYPPLLVLWGGATLVVAGALVNVLVTRWGYRNWIADRVEEWRWKREVRRMRRMEVARKEKELEEVVEEEFVEGDVLLEDEVVEGGVFQNDVDGDEKEGVEDHDSDETGVDMETE